jgi:hypothetical protein
MKDLGGEKINSCEMACEIEKQMGPNCCEFYGNMFGGKVHGKVVRNIDRF